MLSQATLDISDVNRQLHARLQRYTKPINGYIQNIFDGWTVIRMRDQITAQLNVVL